MTIVTKIEIGIFVLILLYIVYLLVSFQIIGKKS